LQLNAAVLQVQCASQACTQTLVRFYQCRPGRVLLPNECPEPGGQAAIFMVGLQLFIWNYFSAKVAHGYDCME